ncbi:hypothetical protein [Tropicibacter sp. S64]|uniref:hypothetical protein n=1 Tax=Tropicibacter sp. S64 TaxID=3415122 RepID=UPI003C7E0046
MYKTLSLTVVALMAGVLTANAETVGSDGTSPARRVITSDASDKSDREPATQTVYNDVGWDDRQRHSDNKANQAAATSD